MKNVLLLFVFIAYNINTYAQEEEVSIYVGNNYSFQNYYSFDENDSALLSHDEWDIAFTVTSESAGIHINEGAAISFSGDPSVLFLYKAPTNEFSDVITVPVPTDSIFNIEADWSYGAFNNQRDENNALDFGWGMMNATTKNIEGNKVFLLQLRNKTWKKVMIVSMTDGIYTIKYADPNGDNENTATIDKSDFSNSQFARFSLASGTTLVEENPWDLLYTRYFDVQDAGGVLVQQGVLGVLSAPGIEVVQADNIDINSVSYENYISGFSDKITEIGWDWKFWNQGYTLIEDRVYFVKLTNDDIWKIYYTLFGGASTGEIEHNREYMGNLTATSDLEKNIQALSIFPNPTTGNKINLVFESIISEKGNLTIHDLDGKIILRKEILINNGLNAITINTSAIIKGQYLVQLNSKNQSVSQKYIKL